MNHDDVAGLASSQIRAFRDSGIVTLARVFESGFEDLRGFADLLFSERLLDASASQTKQVRIVRPHASYPELLKWVFAPPIVDFCRSLWETDPWCVQSQLYLKPPGSSGLGLHQDSFYIRSAPTSCIAVWVALEDADEENGCLIAAPNSHLKGFLSHHEQGKYGLVNGVSRQLYTDTHMRLSDGQQPVAIPAQAGDAVIFDGNIIHGSLPNLSSSRTRKAMVLHFVPAYTTHLSRFHHPPVSIDGANVSQIADYELL